MISLRFPARVRGPARDINRTTRAQDGSLTVGQGTDPGSVHVFFLGENGETTRLSLTAANAALLATMLTKAITHEHRQE